MRREPKREKREIQKKHITEKSQQSNITELYMKKRTEKKRSKLKKQKDMLKKLMS
jgi:hypothetical protein